MQRIIFVCQGNICRSPAAEALFKNRIRALGKESEFEVSSAGLERSTEGEDIDPRMAALLDRDKEAHEPHRAHKITIPEFVGADLVVAMDRSNRILLSRAVSGKGMEKVRLLLEYAGERDDLEDPYYTLDFETAYAELKRGVDAMVKTLVH